MACPTLGSSGGGQPVSCFVILLDGSTCGVVCVPDRTHDVGICSLSVVMKGDGCMWLRNEIGLDMQVVK